MSSSQISTSISDALLALSAFNACYNVASSSLNAMCGFFIIGAAATCGIYRFGCSAPSSNTVQFHQFLSWLASVLGMSLLAAAFHRYYLNIIIANVHAAAALALVLLQQHFAESHVMLITEALSSLAVISILILSILVFNPYAIIGAVLYIVAGLVVGTNGAMYGIPCVDIFHYVLLVGNIALLMGLTRPQSLVYYRPPVMS